MSLDSTSPRPVPDNCSQSGPKQVFARLYKLPALCFNSLLPLEVVLTIRIIPACPRPVMASLAPLALPLVSAVASLLTLVYSYLQIGP